jgi:hypothetical protein
MWEPNLSVRKDGKTRRIQQSVFAIVLRTLQAMYIFGISDKITDIFIGLVQLDSFYATCL